MSFVIPKDFDPRLTLFHKFQEERNEGLKKIKLHSRLVEIAKENIRSNLGNIPFNDKTKLNSAADNSKCFGNDSFREFWCWFDLKNKTKPNIANEVFDNLRLKDGFLNSLNDENVDSVGCYVFINRNGYVVSYVSFAQTYPKIENWNKFTPELFLKFMNLTHKVHIDEQAQTDVLHLARLFSNPGTTNPEKKLFSIFKNKYINNSRYYLFTVPTDDLYGIVYHIYASEQMSKIFLSDFDRIGIALFKSIDQNYIICILINNIKTTPKTQSLSQFQDFDNDESDLFDDSDSSNRDLQFNSPSLSNDGPKRDFNSDLRDKKTMNQETKLDKQDNNDDFDSSDSDDFDDLPPMKQPSSQQALPVLPNNKLQTDKQDNNENFNSSDSDNFDP